MELVNINYSGNGVQTPDLSIIDKPLVNSSYINSSFGEANDYLELYIYSETGDLLTLDYDAFDYYPYLTSNPKNNTYSSLTLDPETDVKNRGYNRGNLNIQYNFYKKLFNSAYGKFYWIKEISTSRTELKLASQVLSDLSIRSGFDQYQSYIASKNYYPIFYLNFGKNVTAVANNVAYTQDDEGAYLLIKLYEPLSPDFDIKTQLWIIDKVADSVSFNVNIQVEAENVDQLTRLRGPNYNVLLNTKNGQTTPYYNYNNLLQSPVTSSFQKLISFYQDRSVDINVDYSNFSNFIHFSSATERVNNFVYKLQLIDAANANILDQQSIIGGSGNVNIAASASIREQNIIDNIIKNFDIYEYFLYFESSSWAWPKSNSTQPYTLYSVTSSQAQNFLGSNTTIPTATTASLLFSASYYDSTNKDLFHNSIPQYLLDDPSNQPYITFLDMIGQHFDNIWVYYKDVSNRFNATNNPDTGISLDLVSDALRGLGFQLFTNTNVSDNLYYTLFGINPDGSLLPPTGSELITNYVTSSIATLPAETIQDEIYKRLYHNIPYLYKTKGTARSIKALVSIYGIPQDILTIREFGGNFTGSLDGMLDLNSSEYKINITTSSLQISSSLLSPYTTLQYYQDNTRLNSTNVEVGFSPADVINTNISASQGIFSLDQLIGSPGYQYSSSYSPLVSASNAYFVSYNKPNSVWEYIRLLKFYNNSLFKTIKNFVPARADISTGIIVKSHMLERNKYARHEPIITFNDYSQSIDMVEITGSEGGALVDSTSWSGFIVTPLGLASYSSSKGIEKFTGELSGSEIIITDGQAMEQGEYSSTLSGSYGSLVNLGALYQNVSASVRSEIFFDLDYNSDLVKPVNYGIVTQSISQSQVNNYATYTNPNSPYAQLQDYNYQLKRSIIPRYIGSKTVSATYNTYTNGDQSYGKTAAIDKIKYQYGYLVDIYSASKFLPGRSNAQIKYIIDNSQNVLDLTKVNKNIFTVQNVYKSGETANVSLFEYDEQNPYSQQLANNPDLQIYEGGWRYLPVLHNLSGSATSQVFNLDEPDIAIGGGGLSPSSPELQTSNYAVSWWVKKTFYDDPGELNHAIYDFFISASYTGGVGVSTAITLTVSSFFNVLNGACNLSTPASITITIPQSSNKGVSNRYGQVRIDDVVAGSGQGNASSVYWPDGYSNCTISKTGTSAAGSGGGGGEYAYYTSQATVTQTCLYYLSQSNEIVFNATMSGYYANNGITFDSTSDPAWSTSGLDPVIFSFNPTIGDRISIYDVSSSLGWNELSEYTIKNTRFSGSTETTTGSVFIVELDRGVNLAAFSSGSGVQVEPITRAPYKTCRYIVWKHVPDETNVMLRYNPKDATIVENGILFPEYIDPTVRDNAGNVVKALKQQNLI